MCALGRGGGALCRPFARGCPRENRAPNEGMQVKGDRAEHCSNRLPESAVPEAGAGGGVGKRMQKRPHRLIQLARSHNFQKFLLFWLSCTILYLDRQLFLFCFLEVQQSPSPTASSPDRSTSCRCSILCVSFIHNK